MALRKQDSKSVPPRTKPTVHFAADVAKGAESDPGFNSSTSSSSPERPRRSHEYRKPLYTRIREAFGHLTHHHDVLSSSGESAEFKHTHKMTSSPQGRVSSTSSSSLHSTPTGHSTYPIAIPSPRKHRSFWGFFGKRLEREEIEPNSPIVRHSGARSVISIDDKAMKLIRETVPEVSEPEDITFSTKYRFVNSKIIGKGVSGVVRLACPKDVKDSQLTTSCLFAVKEFRRRKREETTQDYLRKITSEFCIATTMHHVNVIETVDMVHDKERWYEIMEYCPGGDLFNAIAHGGLDDEQIDSCFRELVDGVSYLHSLGVAHRDLKPENILVDCEGHSRITDFGVSDVFKVVWERLPHKSRGLCGSSPYIAPEEYGGDEYDAQKVDVWSLGIIYYAMVFHSVPWEEATMNDPQFAVYARCGQDAFEPFQRLPKYTRDLLKGMLQVDPAKRISIEEVQSNSWIRKIQFVPLPVIPIVVINKGAVGHRRSASGSINSESASVTNH